MTKKVLAVEIGVRYTRICEMTGYTDKPVIHNCITFATPKGTIEDGFIRDKATLAAIINQKLAEMRTKLTDAVFILNSTKIANREILVPNMKEEKVRSLVDMQASDYFPIDISEYTVSYYYMSKIGKKKSAEEKNKILLLAAPNNLLQSYVNLADACQLRIVAIDYIGNSYYQVAKKQVESGVNITIHIGDNTSIINIMENENLLLQRIIPYGADEVIDKVRRSDVFKANSDEEAIRLLCQEKVINYQFELPKEEISVKYSMASESYDKAKQEIRAKEEITDALRFIVNNVIRVLDYFTAKNSDKKISSIYISGLGAKFQGVVHLFKNELGFDVRQMEEIYMAKFSDKMGINRSEQIDYISCLGAGVHPVVFRLQQSKSKGVVKADLKYFQYAFVFCVAVSVSFTALQLVSKLMLSSKQNSLNNKISQLSSIETVFADHDTAKAKYDNIMAMYALTDNKNENLHELITELEEKLPKNMTVSTLTVNADGLTMHIKSSNKISVAKMIMSLSEIKSICNITVPSIGETVEGKGSGIVTDEFDVSCSYSENTAEESEDETASTEDSANSDTETKSEDDSSAAK